MVEDEPSLRRRTQTTPQQDPPTASKADRAIKVVKPAHAWHSARRAKLVEDPGVSAILRECTGNQLYELAVSLLLAFSIVVIHGGVALWLKQCHSEQTGYPWLSALGLSATVGALCAFNIQALNHELSHMIQSLAGGSGPEMAVSAAAWILGASGSATCHIPWVAYYFGMGHRRHHMLTGSQWDVDGEALFWLWVPPADRSPLQRAVWLTAASILVPVAYGISLGIYAMYDLKKNIPELRLVFFDFCFSCLVLYSVGRCGAMYLFFSSCFSMGMLCHPLVAFWILQHVCVSGEQPTVSYYGNSWWNWLTLNELLHVEHHDMSRLNWRWTPQLRKLRPDLYENLYHQPSLTSLIYQWLMGIPGPHGMRWDFGCKHTWGFDLPGGWAVGEVGMYVGETRVVQDGQREYPIAQGSWCEIVGRDEDGDNEYVSVRFPGMRYPVSVLWQLLAREQ